MDLFERLQTPISPSVNMDSLSGEISFEGMSMMEDPHEFYTAIQSWIKKYIFEGMIDTTISYRFAYFNSSSAKELVKILYLFENKPNNTKIRVVWHYTTGDQLMEERGKELEAVSNLKFEFESTE